MLAWQNRPQKLVAQYIKGILAKAQEPKLTNGSTVHKVYILAIDMNRCNRTAFKSVFNIFAMSMSCFIKGRCY